jgi:uncharacterized membrane protein
MVDEVSTEHRLEQFSARIDPIMVVLAIIWLPVLVVPIVTNLHGSIALTFDVVDYAVWAAFVFEYAAKLWVAVDRKRGTWRSTACTPFVAGCSTC